MAKMMDMMRQVRQLKKLQKDLSRKTVEAANPAGTLRVTASADMTIKRIDIDPSLLAEGNARRLADAVTRTVNQALQGARQAAAADMSALTGGGLDGLLGG